MDDALARRAAQELNLRFTGTLGLLLDAKRRAIIPKVSSALEQLNKAGFRLAEQTWIAVLKLAGEEE